MILEILNPDTLEPVAEGEVGEMVVTTLRKEAVPLIRYRTRDLTAMKKGPCACGSLLPRHDRLLGRSDDMFIVKAVNVYPGQIDNALGQIKGISCEYQVQLDRIDGKDVMRLRVECSKGQDPSLMADTARLIKDTVRRKLLVTPEVELTPYGSLPRNERKTKRVIDNREN